MLFSLTAPPHLTESGFDKIQIPFQQNLKFYPDDKLFWVTGPFQPIQPGKLKVFSKCPLPFCTETS